MFSTPRFRASVPGPEIRWLWSKHAAGGDRGPNGTFISAADIPDPLGSDSDDTVAWETDEDGIAEDSDYAEQWGKQPRPITYEEKLAKVEAWREKVQEKKRAAEIFHNFKGKKRGPYKAGGTSKRSIQEKCKKLRDDHKSGLLRMSDTELAQQIKAIQGQGPAKPGGSQLSLVSMFAKASSSKRPRADSIGSDGSVTEISPPADSQALFPPAKRVKIQTAASGDTSASSAMREEEEESSGDEAEPQMDVEIEPEELEKEARLRDGDAAVDSIIIADSDAIAEWVDTILDDAASQEPAELGQGLPEHSIIRRSCGFLSLDAENGPP
ncbi:hypothetical protein GGX14DRAFT_409131 [Mycena pura]|uniref:Uncharacterized protein n=1 Tax=Mycena pura TaxID=153505 RepID=A0AAD6Y0N0_9AGAR|nr:hypothetical protein GGX14DRAFT_409131 [Mycena pura]